MNAWLRFPVSSTLLPLPGVGGCVGRADASPACDPALNERRAEAMRRLFPKLSAWQAGARQRDAALRAWATLAQADSPADLEARIAELAAGAA